MKAEFRAWDKTQNYMAYQGTPDLETIQSFMLHFGDKPLMQYVGKSDKHGKKIYFGDIVRFKYSTCLSDGFIVGVVVENKHGHSILETNRGQYHIQFAHNGEVIGNIHETPKLNPLTKADTK